MKAPAKTEPKGGQFIAQVKTLPGNPYHGHTLETVIPEIETQIGASLSRIVADRGYRGNNAPPRRKLKVYISDQKRRVTEVIKHACGDARRQRERCSPAGPLPPPLRRKRPSEPTFNRSKAASRTAFR